ncbi:MAG: glycosyltransferase family 4 protein [Xanthomonadaceae bacterium]|nr:glycosyltransferase family 4 protein [Xanthomonadaceae bacterium]
MLQESLSPVDVLAREVRERTAIAQVCLSRSYGGIEQVVTNDILELSQLGIEVRLVCLMGSPVHLKLVDKPGVKIITVKDFPRKFFDMGFRNILNEVCDDKVQILHFYQPSMMGAILPWVWKKKHLVVFSNRHALATESMRTPWNALMMKRLDGVVTMSETLKKNILATHPLKEDRVNVIHLGLDYLVFDPERVDAKRQRAEWGADESTVVIGCVGRIDPTKGQDIVVKAAAGLLVRSKAIDKVKFVIVGEEPKTGEHQYLAQLQEMVKQFGIGDHVVFAGYKENIPEVMNAFDLFVMPARQEAFSLVVVEAMAMETPILISRGGSSDEVVGNNEFGVLTRPADAFDLQRAIRVFLDNPEMRVKMGKAARAHAMKSFARQDRLQQLLGLYERLLRRRAQKNS